jgi:N-acetylneuraminic acid mutarotase
LVGDKIFIAGGLQTPSSPSERKFLSFDLQHRQGAWKQLGSWPGPSRMMAVAGSDGDHFFLFSGAELTNGTRAYLKDAYSYTEREGWKKLADLPWPVTAAPSPAFYSAAQGMFVFGGDAGTHATDAATLRERHPGFSNKILQYNIHKDSWKVAAEMYTDKRDDLIGKPNNSIWAPVTSSLAVWNDLIVFPGGEVRPGTRTPNVIVAKLCAK